MRISRGAIILPQWPCCCLTLCLSIGSGSMDRLSNLAFPVPTFWNQYDQLSSIGCYSRRSLRYTQYWYG